ncbi:MAG: PQQ-binding-like beta-propeller repeat protein, partial [FCB group bacterium]|nr:PQQ-binding-like beta-propeller repeat protein [FCB group bacterium]
MKMRSTGIATTLFIGVIAAFGLFHTGACAADLAMPQLWATGLEVLLETAAITADVTGDGRDEIVVAGHEDLFVLDGRGKIAWHWRSPGRYLTYPAVWSRKGQPGLIYAADNQGNLNCHDGNGKIVWQTKLGAPVLWSASVLCNLDADDTPEVIQTDDAGTVWAFNAEDGSPVWKSAVKGTPVTPAVDAAGRVYIATGAGLLFALDPSGKVLWERSTGGPSPSWATGAPIALENTKALRVAVPSSDGRVLAFDSDGELLWARPARGSLSSTLSAADFDADGVMDIFAITQLGTVMRFDESGRVLWDIDMQGRTLAPGAIADINGDGQLEYVLSTQSGNLLVFDQAGKIVFNHQFNNRTINATPAIADVSPDSPGLELVITGGESGKVLCLGAPGPATAARPWGMYRADASNRGNAGHIADATESANRMSPRNLAWDGLCSGDEVVFDVAKAADDAKIVTATASCVRPDGARQVAMARILRQHGTLRLPVAVAVPGVYRFEWSLADAAGKVLAVGEREMTLEPFAADRATVARAADALKRSAEAAQATLPDSAAALRREAAILAIDADAARPLQEKCAAGNAEEQALLASSAVVKKARRALQLADIVAKTAAQGPGTSLILSKGDLWESRGIGESLPDAFSSPLMLANRAVPGEHEPVAINLFNVTDRELNVRVVADVPEGGPRVILHRAVSAPTARGAEAWDALPELDNAALVSIPSLSTRQVWVDCDFAGVKAGDCAIKVSFIATNGAGILGTPLSAPQDIPSPEAIAELKFNVAPFEMAPSGIFRLCSWASLDATTIPDLLAHGNNVFCVPLPEAKYNEQGQLAASDYTKTDALLNRLKGNDVMILLTGE